MIGNLIFMNPWVLAGLAALPVLYFLLRIMPPAPKLIVLPTARFVKDLIPETQTPSHTPWWILLLRLFIAALVLIALAGPVYNPAGQSAGSGPLRLVIENGWPSAQNWNTQIRAAEEILTQATRQERDIYLLTTAPAAGDGVSLQTGPVGYAEGLSVLRGLKPLPWPSDYEKAATLVNDGPAVENIWFGSGIDDGNLKSLVSALEGKGSLTYIMPDANHLPVLLGPAPSAQGVQINLTASTGITEGMPITVQAMDQNGRVLDSRDITFSAQKTPVTATFDIPESLRGDLGSFRVSGRASAGTVFLLDDRYSKRSVGIVSPAEESESAPLVEAGYYLKRALEPYTTLTLGTAEDLIEQNPSVIVLPDVGTLPAETMTRLEEWVRKGGLLLRFAGPNMAGSEGESYLTPVPLRKGGRALDGSMTWEQPQTLAPFAEGSPFYGLKISDEITVRQQILPEPSPDIDAKTWARLADGTPLITANALDRGMLVLIHTTATPQWSDLAVSGLYVELLRRIVTMSGGAFDPSKIGTGSIDPLSVLDGFGTRQEPDSTVRAIAAEEFSDTMPGPSHPPGIYGNSSIRQAFNLGDHIHALKGANGFSTSTKTQTYGSSYERDLMPYLLYGALLLLFADWFIMLLIAAGNRPFWRFTAILFLFLLPLPAQAQSADNLKHAEGLYLAYVITGEQVIDSTSRTGLEALAQVLKQRTSVEPDGVAGVNPESDELAFYPILYWPVSAVQAPLSPAGIANVQKYLDHGGTILFDTRDENYKAGNLGETQNSAVLRSIIGNLNVPPLAPAPKDHVLTKSFYLLESFPGRYSGGTLWVEQQSVSGRDGVSSVIIGGNDWASAWAMGRNGGMGSRQQEMSMRFGVNLVIYALTGNYKADQVHVPFILERLGQ